MFKLKYAKMCDNTIFTKYNMVPVIEDYFIAKENIFCVADGVTRDSIHGTAIPYPKDKKEVEEWLKVYPNPSGAYEAAKICAENFAKYISKEIKQINKQVILESVKKVNRDIWKINEKRSIDYLKNDLFCCVAVGGCIINNVLYCFSIGDCHIEVLDKDCNIEFSTKNNHLQFEDYLNNVYCKEHEYNWNNNEDRKMVRRDYRNKPKKAYNGQDISFGVLSGEKEAEYYIDVYEINLNKAKYICAYSDGCEPFFASKENIIDVVNKPSKIEHEGKERTLIIYESN